MLGPVFYRFGKAGAERHWTHEAALAMTAPRGEALFAAGIALAWKGRFKLEVVDGAGPLLARRTFTVAKPPPCHWQLFAEPADEDAWTFAVRHQGVAAMPRFHGQIPLRTWTGQQEAAKRLKRADGTEELLPEDELPTDRTRPGGSEDRALQRTIREGDPPDFPLKLSLEKRAFVIRSGVKMNDDVELCFLARWWINDKPVPAPRTNAAISIERARLVRYRNELRVKFALPEGVKDLKPGDKVGLQVAYCPTGWEMLPVEPSARLAAAFLIRKGLTVPILSNRLDFNLTRDLLRQAHDARQK
jgi:hypothetical protein